MPKINKVVTTTLTMARHNEISDECTDQLLDLGRYIAMGKDIARLATRAQI